MPWSFNWWHRGTKYQCCDCGLNVKRFGADPEETAANNRAAIQAALDEANNRGGGTVCIPPGLYEVDSSLIIYSNVNLMGANRLASRIRANLTNQAIIRPQNTVNNFDLSGRILNCFIKDLGVDNTAQTNAGGVGIDWRQISLGGLRDVDIRNCETGLLVGNVAYHNVFDTVSANSCGTCFRLENGPNDNLFTNCRANNCHVGFEVVDGPDGSLNNTRFQFCKIEPFTGHGFRVEHTGSTPAPISNLVFEQCRIEAGPTGIEYIESTPNSGQIRNCLICQCHYVNCDMEVHNATAILQRNTEIRTGVISPVRVGDLFSNADDYSLLLFRQITGQTFIRNNANSVPFDLVANDLTVDSVGGGTERINTPRIRLADATLLTADDFSLSPGWGGDTATISSVNGYDSGATVTIASAGIGQSDNPQVTLTFSDGAFPAAPLIIAQRAGGDQAEVQFTVGNVSNTEVSFVFQGTPAAGESYTFNFLAISR